MTVLRESLTGLFRLSLTNPKAAARQVLDASLPGAVVWQALLLVVILGMLQSFAYDALVASPNPDPLLPVFRNAPLLTTAIAFAVTLAMVHAIHRVGRLFGGTGSFQGALILTVWLQTVMLVLNFVQLLFLVLLPPFAALLGFVNLGLMLWLLTSFVAVLHGFRSLFPVFLMILATGFVMGFLLLVLLTTFGVITPQEVTNV